MRDHVLGLDHVVLAVRDLAAAADRWRALGFTVSPRGLHSEYLGTANHTVMFDDDYVELLGVVAPTPFNTPTRDFLSAGPGLERLALRTDDAAAGLAALTGAGIAGLGPFEFRRPVSLDDGAISEAAFRVFLWPLDERPGGANVFACQHLTRETVWLKSLTGHANGARGLKRIEIVSPDPAADAALAGRMLGVEVKATAESAHALAMGPRGAEIAFLDAAAFAARWTPPDGLSATCGIVLSGASRASAAPYARWAAPGGRLCASVDGALMGWEVPPAG